MRISDWSSDVCSSDLHRGCGSVLQQSRDVLGDKLIGRGHRFLRGLCHTGWAAVSAGASSNASVAMAPAHMAASANQAEIGRASRRERVWKYVYISVVAVSFKKTKNKIT